MNLEIRNASCGYEGKTVISGISFTMASRDSLCLLGPNGVGKTTLFKTILGLLKLQAGQILLDGEDIATWSRKEFAMKVGYVPQAHTPPFPFKVIDVVVVGRSAHLAAFSSPGKEDFEIAEECLVALGIAHLRGRIYTEISGGERQLVLIARALAQRPELLIMDEPTANLDFGNQIKVLNQIKKLVHEGDLGVIMTTHFPNHAFFTGSKVAVMGKDNTFEIGTAEEVITEEHLKRVYGVEVKIVTVGGKDHTTKAVVPVA
jgi:iron complex transport system ATP-binding protein